MPKKPSTETRLKDAKEAAAEATGKIRELEGKRADALLRDDDDGATKVLAEIERLRLFVRNTEDKAALLQAELKKEETLRHARFNAGLIGRVETKLAAREATAEQIQAGIGHLNRLALELMEQSRAIDAAWGWSNSDRFGLALLRDGLLAAMAHELYRQSAIPKFGGGQNEGPLAGFQLPGSRPPRLDLVHQPKKIPSLVEVMRDASIFASDVMHGRRPSTATAPTVLVAPQEPRERTAAEVEMAGLLKRQSELAAIPNPSPEDDRAYADNTTAIAKLSAETEGAKADAQR
jgi:hypothetical protein